MNTDQSIVNDWRFIAIDIRPERFHLRQDKDLWEREALPIHEWATRREEFTIAEALSAGHSWAALILLVKKGAIQHVNHQGFALGGHLDDERFIEMSNALRIRELRLTNWKVAYKDKGEQDEPSEVIARIVCDEAGKRSGTTRLVVGPGREVVQLHFTPGDRPYIAVHYVPEDKP